MTKIKYLFALIALAFFYACGDDDATVVNFDHEAQAIIDNDSIVKFLKNNYFNEDNDSIMPIKNGESALFTDSRLLTKVVNEYGIDYTYYVFVQNEGTPNIDKGFPTVIDSIFPIYKLRTILNATEVKKQQDLTSPTWFNPLDIINGVRGWLHAFTHFKNGNNITNNGPITYENGGKGFFILPSGLSYRNSGSLPNKILLYYIELFDFIENTDHDRDKIPSFYEDIDEDGIPWNDDTDGDGILNFLDTDDDNDLIPTRDEDANGDGDPRNDFSDPNNPTLPDYLNRKVRNQK